MKTAKIILILTFLVCYYNNLFSESNLLYEKYKYNKNIKNDDRILSGFKEADWITFLGGKNNDVIKSIIVDDEDNIIIAGHTSSSDFAITSDAFQKNLKGGYDLFISKFDKNYKLIWSTYLGGSGTEMMLSICLDKNNNIWLTGESQSGNFPVTNNAFSKVHSGNSDVIISELSKDGKLIYSTFIGGGGYDCGSCIVADSNSNIYVVGRSFSSDFPVSFNAIKKTKGNWYVGVLIKINTISYDLYSTFIGYSHYIYSENSFAEAVAIDKNDNIIVCGFTNLDCIPVVNSKLQAGFNGKFDGYIMKFDKYFNLLWSSYFGGSGLDRLFNVGLDSDDNIYLLGYSTSNDLSLLNEFQTKNNGDVDGFLLKLSPEGLKVWCTYIGGSRNEGKTTNDNDTDVFYSSLKVANENIYTTFKTNSNNILITGDFFQESNKGNYDVYSLSLSLDGVPLNSTYIGGINEDNASDIFVMDSIIYIVGSTSSNDFPVTSNAYQLNKKNYTDGFIAKFGISLKDIDAPYIQSTNDSCGILKEIIVADSGVIISGIDSWAIEYNQNCNVAFERISQNLVKFTVSLIYESEKGIYRIWVFDKEKNMKVIEGELNPSLEVPIRFIPETKFEMPKPSYAFQLIKDKIGIFNFSDSEIVIDNLFLSINTNFSIPQSQFPLIIPAKQTVPLEICFFANKYFSYKYYDTISYVDKCGFIYLPISIELEPTVFSGNSNCNVPIYCGSDSMENIEAMINPQPATEDIQIQFNRPVKEELNFEIYNSYGDLIITRRVYLNNENRCNFSLSTFESGMYFLLLKSSKLLIRKKLLIVK